MNTDPIVIVGLARTPTGAFQGELKGFGAPDLGAAAIRAASGHSPTMCRRLPRTDRTSSR